MTEQEYILATDKRALDCALDALHQIVPESNPHIPADSYRKLRHELAKLRDSLSQAIHLEEVRP